MVNTTLDALKAARASIASVRDQCDRLLGEMDVALAAVPTTADLQSLLSQLMDAAPSVIKAVTPVEDVAAEVAPETEASPANG